MPRRALLKFRNPDSTQDINDRFQGLFSKGFFSGGQITAVPGVLKIDLAPFATAGSDGMFVREDSETTRLDVTAGFKNYIVVRQEYVSNSDPILSIESLTEPEFLLDGPAGQQGADNPNLIVFGVVNVPGGSTATTAQMIEIFESDIVDPLGYLEFRGLLSAEIDLPSTGANQNRAGDFYIVTDGSGDQPKIFAWNGVAWIDITNAADVLELLNQHRQNILSDEIHLTDLQAEAVAGSAGTPNNSNRFVTESDDKILTEDEANANAGNYVPSPATSLEDSPPSDSNRWVSSSKVFAAPTELAVTISSSTQEIELPAQDGPYYVGTPADSEALLGTVQQWFNLYSAESEEDVEFVNGDFQAVRITAVETGDPGLGSSGNELNPQTSGAVDDLGFFTDPTLSLYLILDNPVDSDVRVAYGKRTSLGTLLPHLLMNRGPKGGQLDTRILRLLLGTPNAQFNDPTIWEGSVAEGAVVAFNTLTSKFVNADPNGDLFPVGIRGNYNNLIMEGLYTANSNLFSVDFLYADKANPGSLTNSSNEWFIGRAISSTQLLVNMNQIAIEPNGETVPPVTFPEALFNPAIQPGTPIAWSGTLFEIADSDDPSRLPLGIKGTSNNVIQNGKYTALVGTPFVSGVRLYAGADAFAGVLVTTENDWYMGIGIDDTTMLVNANGVPIPAQWEEEHSSGSGYHKFKFGSEATRDLLSPDSGMIFLRDDTTPPRIEYWDGSTWQFASADHADIPAGSKMLFMQDSVPTGWTLDVAVNDAVVRVVDSEALGGVTGGSWTITGFQADPHALTISEMPAHTHNIDGVAIATGDASGFSGLMRNLGGATDSTGGGTTHEHAVSNDGTWRPSYINAIVCIRD